MAKFSLCRENIAKKHKKRRKNIMILFGSAATAARNLRGEEYFNKMIGEVANRTKEAEKKIGLENDNQLKKVNSILERVTEFEGMDAYEAEQLGLIYNNLAPDDISHPISAKMVKAFLEQTVKVQKPEAYEKILRYYDFKNPLSDKQMKKLGIFVENIWNQYRTVEYCYKYSKSFYEFVNKYASKVDAEGMNNIEKIKWLRLWIFIIKDQGFFWNDIREDERIDVNGRQKFDREVYLFPDTMLYLELYVSEMPEASLNVEMLKKLISLYPEDVQKKIYTWAEMVGDTSNTNILRAGEVRMLVKRTLFPITWMSSISLFCMNNYMKDNNPKYLESAVNAYKDGGIENLAIIKRKGTDPFDNFKIKSFKCYELYSTEEDEIEKVLVVNCQNELRMYVEVYKWLLEHPEFKFGPEDKNLSEYGIENLLDEEPELNSDWFLQMGLVDSEEDINWELFDRIVNRNDKAMDQYLKGEISAEEFYEDLGFSTDMQAKACCNKKAKLIPAEAAKMAAALKRIKMFGIAQAIKSDLIYLEIFKYMLSEKPENLPKNMVNLYGKVFK